MLPFTEVAQHLRRRFTAAAAAAAPAVALGVIAAASAAAAAATGVDGVVLVAHDEFLVFEQQHPHHGHLHRIGQTGVFVNQRHLVRYQQLTTSITQFHVNYQLMNATNSYQIWSFQFQLDQIQQSK